MIAKETKLIQKKLIFHITNETVDSCSRHHFQLHVHVIIITQLMFSKCLSSNRKKRPQYVKVYENYVSNK